MNNDFWNAERASSAVDVRPSGSRRRRRMNRSADEPEVDGTPGAVTGGATGAVSIGGWSAVVLMAEPNGTSL